MKKEHRKLFRLLFTLLLLAALPLFIWAILTQRIELRKRAATGEPTPTCVPRPACLDANPRCLMPEPVDGWCFSGTPTPPAGCYYQQVQCIQAPCNPILVCPTPTPTPIQNTCVRGKPIVVILPSNQNGNPGDTRTYTANIVNTDSQTCGSSPFELTTQVDTNFSAQLQYNSLPVPASASAHVNLNVTSPATNTFGLDRSTPISLTAINTNSNNSHTGYASYTLLMPQPQTMKLHVKLAGVTDGTAQGAKVAVKFYKKDGSTLQLSEPLSLSHEGNGVYTTSAIVTNPFAGGTQFRIKIKGEKHVSIEFCRQSGQTGPCQDTDYITVPNPAPTDYVFDFTGVPLPPGDLTTQDGQANRADLDKLTTLMSKLCENLTIAEKLIGDVDYNGCINVRDIFLILQTLETRYDQ